MVVLYSTGCPRCKVLKAKIEEKNIQYEERGDVEEMIEKGYQAAPILEVDGKPMEFREAVDWVNGR